MRAIYLTRWAVVALLLLPPFCFAQQPNRVDQFRILFVRRLTDAGEKRKDPYIGEWSNGRGDTLVITGSTIKFGRDKAVSYRDITRVTDGKEFNLEITTQGDLNYLTKFLHISIAEGDKSDEMKMTLYDSRKDMEAGENSQGEATWYRDK